LIYLATRKYGIAFPIYGEAIFVYRFRDRKRYFVIFLHLLEASLRQNFPPTDGCWREWLIDAPFFARVNLFTYIDPFARYNALSFSAAMLGVNLISDII